MYERTQAFKSIFVVLSLFGVGACGPADVAEEGVTASASELAACMPSNPVITEVREENPGAVAPGVAKVYHLTLRNTNSEACAPATFFLVADAFQFFRTSVQPASQAGVGSNGVANFRLEVTSDPSVPEGVTDIGFTVVSSAGGSVRGSVAYEVDLDSPTGCNRQAPRISVEPTSPPAVALGTPITYRVTARNADNAACGSDVFTLIPDFVRFFSISTSSAVPIAPGGSGTFEVTATAQTMVSGVREIGFTLVGSRHGGAFSRGALRYEVR